jgi:hypothetical protein
MANPSIVYRAHEWIADHVSWVQYPDVSGPRAPIFKNEMPWWRRLALIIFGFAVLVLCAIAAFFLLLLLWAVVTA